MHHRFGWNVTPIFVSLKCLKHQTITTEAWDLMYTPTLARQRANHCLRCGFGSLNCSRQVEIALSFRAASCKIQTEHNHTLLGNDTRTTPIYISRNQIYNHSFQYTENINHIYTNYTYDHIFQSNNIRSTMTFFKTLTLEWLDIMVFWKLKMTAEIWLCFTA